MYVQRSPRDAADVVSAEGGRQAQVTSPLSSCRCWVCYHRCDRPSSTPAGWAVLSLLPSRWGAPGSERSVTWGAQRVSRSWQDSHPVAFVMGCPYPHCAGDSAREAGGHAQRPQRNVAVTEPQPDAGDSCPGAIPPTCQPRGVGVPWPPRPASLQAHPRPRTQPIPPRGTQTCTDLRGAGRRLVLQPHSWLTVLGARPLPPPSQPAVLFVCASHPSSRLLCFPLPPKDIYGHSRANPGPSPHREVS